MITIFPKITENITLPGNDYLKIYYTSVANSVWEVSSKEWHKWKVAADYIPPQNNSFLVAVTNGGIPLELHEHASICVGGSSFVEFKTEEGNIVEYNWTVGEHNVENGYGYNPTLGFRREIANTFSLCCIGSDRLRTDWSVKHRFEVLTSTSTLTNGASFVHVAIGGATIDGIYYAPRGTAFNVAPSTTVTLDPGSSVIICKVVS